jgi:hypothetical protein
MIKTTLGKLANLRDNGTSPGPITKLALADDSTPFVNKVLIARFLKPIVAELLEHQSTLAKLGAKYGKPSPEHGYQLVVTGDDVAAYRKELDDLLKIEFEISASPLPAAAVEKVGLTPNDLLLLEDFLDLGK